MSKTKIWSLQFTCRRLAREARSLGRTVDPSGALAKEIEQHLATAARLLTDAMDQLASAARSDGSVLDMAQRALGDDAWASASPLADYKEPQRSAPSPDHEMALRGGGRFLAIPDLIAFLCSMHRSGVLLIDTVDERFTVELEHGDIVHAHSDGAPDGERLGDVLVEQGVVEQAALEAILAEGIRGRFGGRLGARLLERELATQEQLVSALETQIRRLFQRLFKADAREFVFWEGPCVWGEQSMRLNATMLLLDGARAFDESSRDFDEALDFAEGLDGLEHKAAVPIGRDAAAAAVAHSEHPLSPTPHGGGEVTGQSLPTGTASAGEPTSGETGSEPKGATPAATKGAAATATAADSADRAAPAPGGAAATAVDADADAVPAAAATEAESTATADAADTDADRAADRAADSAAEAATDDAGDAGEPDPSATRAD